MPSSTIKPYSSIIPVPKIVIPFSKIRKPIACVIAFFLAMMMKSPVSIVVNATGRERRDTESGTRSSRAQNQKEIPAASRIRNSEAE